MDYDGSGGGGGGGPKTLYVGNLNPEVSESLLLSLFGHMGPVKGCKIIREPGNSDPYAFIEFGNNAAASAALSGQVLFMHEYGPVPTEQDESPQMFFIRPRAPRRYLYNNIFNRFK